MVSVLYSQPSRQEPEDDDLVAESEAESVTDEPESEDEQPEDEPPDGYQEDSQESTRGGRQIELGNRPKRSPPTTVYGNPADTDSRPPGQESLLGDFRREARRFAGIDLTKPGPSWKKKGKPKE